jgi:hypothetical protein
MKGSAMSDHTFLVYHDLYDIIAILYEIKKALTILDDSEDARGHRHL